MAQQLRVGVAGLGTVAQRLLPEIVHTPGVKVAAGADLRAEARAAFESKYGGKAFPSVEAMCASPDIDVVWVASPNPFHHDHAVLAARSGKHVVCEKPLGISLDQCSNIVNAVEKAGVRLVIGHSKTYDPQVRKMGEIVRSGRLGRVVHIDSLVYNEWLQRPRLPEEVDSDRGGGVVFRQGPHQFDIVRYLAGGMVTRVQGNAGRFDPGIATEGNFSALVEFDNGTTASVNFYGYGAFDVHELLLERDAAAKMRGRKPLRRSGTTLDASQKFSAATQAAVRQASNIPPTVGKDGTPQSDRLPYWGLTFVGCERGVIRQTDKGLLVYTLDGCEEIAVELPTAASPELLELTAALAQGRPTFPDAHWGRATLEVCVAVLQSSKTRADVIPQHQVAPR